MRLARLALLSTLVGFWIGCIVDPTDELDEPGIDTVANVCLSTPGVPCCDDGDDCTRDWRGPDGACQSGPIEGCE